MLHRTWRPTLRRASRPLSTGLIAGALMAWTFWGAASAEARTMQQKLDAACARDIAALCAEAGSDPERVKACLLAKRAQASPACMALIDASE